METKNAEPFWGRYKKIIKKDLPVLTNTGIKQSTLSSWKRNNLFPRADDAYLIANVANTTVEYLVTEKDVKNTTCSVNALEVAIVADKLTEEGIKILLKIAESLEFKYHK